MRFSKRIEHDRLKQLSLFFNRGQPTALEDSKLLRLEERWPHGLPGMSGTNECLFADTRQIWDSPSFLEDLNFWFERHRGAALPRAKQLRFPQVSLPEAMSAIAGGWSTRVNASAICQYGDREYMPSPQMVIYPTIPEDTETDIGFAVARYRAFGSPYWSAEQTEWCVNLPPFYLPLATAKLSKKRLSRFQCLPVGFLEEKGLLKQDGYISTMSQVARELMLFNQIYFVYEVDLTGDSDSQIETGIMFGEIHRVEVGGDEGYRRFAIRDLPGAIGLFMTAEAYWQQLTAIDRRTFFYLGTFFT